MHAQLEKKELLHKRGIARDEVQWQSVGSGVRGSKCLHARWNAWMNHLNNQLFDARGSAPYSSTLNAMIVVHV
jgi:hypothetical protein